MFIFTCFYHAPLTSCTIKDVSLRSTFCRRLMSSLQQSDFIAVQCSPMSGKWSITRAYSLSHHLCVAQQLCVHSHDEFSVCPAIEEKASVALGTECSHNEASILLYHFRLALRLIIQKQQFRDKFAFNHNKNAAQNERMRSHKVSC